MKLVTQELAALLDYSAFREHHGDLVAFDGDVRTFLESTMDEVRTTLSRRIGRSVLEILGLSDFDIFRDTVLRRELTGTIAYLKQRDHSSHTVYNYLLGWYFFQHSHQFRDTFTRQATKRGAGQSGAPFPFSSTPTYFGCVWQYASLLHDVGYMFEGGIPSLDLRTSSEQAAIGAQVARTYFNRSFWLDHDLDLDAKRSLLFKSLGEDGERLRPPAFDKTESLAEIADSLRFVGDLQALVACVLAEKGLPPKRMPKPEEFKEFSGDAFDLWSQHYEQFENRRMADRIHSLRNVFNGLIDSGLPEVDVCLLDHGVCSGLLQLLASTYYYRLYAAARAVPKPRPLPVRRFFDEKKWCPAFWWTGIVWATAAAAVHNVQQMASADRLDPDWPGKLTLPEDPLAYMGLLVDTLEEWDRYSVFKSLDREPIQGKDVELGHRNGTVRVRFRGAHGSDRAEDLRKDLDQGLHGWGVLLEVEP